MPASTIGIYTRTSITTDKYDRYEKKLLLYCKQQGWGNVKYYHDRAGGTADEGELKDLAQAFGDLLSGKASNIDAADIGKRLAEMENMDAEHTRDHMRRLMSDIDSGAVNIVLLHDLSQLGKRKMEAFQVLQAMMDKVEVHMPDAGKIHADTVIPCGSSEDYF